LTRRVPPCSLLFPYTTLFRSREFYKGRPFVRVTTQPPHSKWATGSNLVFVSYAADPDRGIVIAMGAIDNLGKGAAGQAVQNANLDRKSTRLNLSHVWIPYVVF